MIHKCTFCCEKALDYLGQMYMVLSGYCSKFTQKCIWCWKRVCNVCLPLHWSSRYGSLNIWVSPIVHWQSVRNIGAKQQSLFAVCAACWPFRTEDHGSHKESVKTVCAIRITKTSKSAASAHNFNTWIAQKQFLHEKLNCSYSRTSVWGSLNSCF